MFIKILTSAGEGKTKALCDISKCYNSKDTIWIACFAEEIILGDKITKEINTNLTLSTIMTKYLALGYKNFFIDDVSVFEWDYVRLDDHISRLNSSLYNLEKLSRQHKVNIFVTIQTNKRANLL